MNRSNWKFDCTSPTLLKRFPGVNNYSRVVVGICLAGLLAPFLSSAFSGSDHVVSWVIDLAAHWQWAYLGGLVIAGLVATCMHPIWMLVFLAAPLPWFSASSRMADANSDGRALSVASANVHAGNRDPTQLLAWLKAVDADLAVVIEVSPEFAKALEVTSEYRYRRIVPSSDPFGIALISRIPLTGYEIFESKDGIPHIEAKFEWAGGEVAIVAFHPMPPIAPSYHVNRNLEMRELTTRFNSAPSILAGDFNATPWSSAFAGIAATGFKRAGGLQPTWPATWGGLFGIPIDHVLASKHWKVMASSVGPNIGSDHLPVLARLVMETRM